MRIFAVTLALGLLFGSSAHAFVPHDHGEEHNHGEASVVWQSLHSSLHHEDKKILPVFLLLTVLGAVHLAQFVRPRRPVRAIVDSLEDALRRGIVPYRKFS